ncbi:mucin-2-like [Uloborus diversus]|uniref:mucin-2-like n=1 Tax=Uloborus diversus TaxID=327109 RepID=UPI00240A2A69|nr:mucin-2-like [Uloborus diversus]
MNKQILTCDFADEVPCDHFRQRKLLQDGDNYDYNLEVDSPQDVATVSSVSEGEEPNVDPEGGDSVNAGGSEYESLDNLEKNDVNVEEKEDVSENPENSDSVNGGQNEDVDFTDILLPTATSPKATYETTSEALSVTTKMQSSETKLSNNKTVEDDVNVLPTISVADKSDNPSSQPEKSSVSSTLSYDRTFEYSPNPSPTTSTTIAIQVATKVTDSLFSQQELQHSTTMKPNINNQTNKSTTENNLLFDNAVSGNKLASTKQDETKSSSVTSEEFKTEAKAINTTYPPNNTKDSSEHAQTNYTTKSIITTQSYTSEVPNDKVSNSLNANDDSYDIVSDAETTSETLAKRTTNLSTEASVFFTSYTESNATLNTTTKSLSNTTSDSVFYSTANPTTISTPTFNSTTKSFTVSDAHKVNTTTEKSAESISTASSLKNASEIKELSSSVTEQNRIPTNEYKSNSDILQGTTTIHTNISSATTHSSDEASSFKLENSSQKLDTETISNEEVNSTYAEDANETMSAFTTESLQQTTLEYKNSTTVDFLVSSTTTSNATTESNYVNLENKTSSENGSMEKSSATKPSTDQKFSDVATISYSMSDKLSASVVTPVTTNIESTGFTTATNEDEPTTTTTRSQEKKTEASKDIGYSSRADEMKVESNGTTPERQLSSEIIAVTDEQTSSFAATMINEQTTGMEKTVIGEQTNGMVLSTNKYQNDNVETTISELMVSVESTTADNEASNLITNVTNYLTNHELKSDVPITPSRLDEMKVEPNSTTPERQLSSEIIAVTDKHTTSFATTMINQQTSDAEKIIGEQTNSVEISTNKYQNDNVETTKSEQKISVESTTADSEASNLIVNVTNYQTSYELKSDVPTTPLTEQKDSVATTMIEGKTSRTETTKIYEQTTGIKHGISEQENGTEISTYDTQMNYEKNNILEGKSLGTTPKISQASSMETGADNTHTNNLDASTVNELTSDDQTTPTVEQNNIATLLIDDQTIYVETTTTYEPMIDENLSSVDATSIGENHSEVSTPKTMEYFSTEATTTTDEYTMSASSTTTEQRLSNVEATEIQKQSNDVTIASVKDFASSVITTGTYIRDSSSHVMTEKEESIMDATTVEEIPLNVSTSKTDDHSNITETVSDKEQEIIFETTVAEYLPNMTGVTTEKDTDAMATLTTYEQLIPIYKTEGTTRHKISSGDPNIETTSVEKLSTVSYTATEKSQTADEKISDEQKEELLSNVSTIIVDEELSTVEVTETDKKLMSAPSTTEKDQITTKSDTKERLTTLPTRNEDVTDIKTLTTVKERGTIVTSKTGDYLSNVVTATANNIGITGIEDETENVTELPTEIEQMNSSITTEDLSSLPVSTIKEQQDGLITATTDQDLSGSEAFTTTDKLASVTTPLIPAVTTEKYVSSISTIADDKYTTNDENSFKTETLSTYIENSTYKDSTESTVTTEEFSDESTTETDELLKNDDVTTSNKYLRPIITSTIEKTFNIVVTSTTEKPSMSTDNFPTDDYARNKDTQMTEKDFITVGTTKTVAFFTDIDNSTTEQSPLTAVKESSSLKTKEFNENQSVTKTEIQNESSIDSTTIEWHSNNLSSPTRKNTNVLPLTTTEDQQISLSETTDVEELSSLKAVANTEEPRNTEPVANSFSLYTTMAENELKTVTAAVVEETSFFTAEKYPRGQEIVTTVEYLIDNYTSTRQKYPSGDDPTTMKGSPTSIDTITTAEYPSSADPATMKENSTSIDSITSAEYPSTADPTTMKENPTSINTITSFEYLISTDPITTKENPTSIDTITSAKYRSSTDPTTTNKNPTSIDSITSVEYPSSETPTTTEEKPTTTDTHTTAEYRSRKDTIFTEKYSSSINPVTTTTHRNASDYITTLSNMNDIDTDEYSSNIDTITTEKYASINYLSTEENSSGFYSTITEKYSSNLDMTTTDEYPSRPVTVEINTSTIDSNTSEEYIVAM